VIRAHFPLSDLGCKVIGADGAVRTIAPGQTEWSSAFTIPEGEWLDVACANDGKNVAMMDKHSHLYHWNAADSAVPPAMVNQDWILFSLAISPNSQYAVTERPDGALVTFDMRRKEVRHVHLGFTFKENNAGHYFAFSHDGSMLAAYLQNNLAVLDFPSLDLKHRVTNGSTFAVAFSRDNRLLSFGRPNQTVEIVEAATGKPIQTFVLGPHFAQGMAFSPTNQTLATAGGSAVNLWHVPTGQHIATFPVDRQVNLSAVAFSADGQKLVAQGSTGKEVRLFLWQLDAEKGE
jgi:WD40 repeat protein